jgi:hypothetical protein
MARRIRWRRDLCKAAVHVVACAGVSLAHAAEPLEKSVAGSYDVLICKDSCPASGDQGVLLKGRVVLFAASLQQTERDRLRLEDSFMGPEVNGCFALEKLPDRGYKGYAGITKAGLTAWSIEGDELRFLLYRSPDAGYRVIVQRTKIGFEGTGQSWGAGVAAPPERTPEKVVLRRTGAAEVSRCPVGQG